MAAQLKLPTNGKCKKKKFFRFTFQYIHRKEKRMVYLDPLGIGGQSEETFRVAR